MKLKKIFLFTTLFVLFLMIGAASASDDVNFNETLDDSIVLSTNNQLTDYNFPSRSTQLIYVDVDGNDENSGESSDQPFKTINKAISTVSTGDANIYLSNGIFSGEGNNNLNIVNEVKLNFIGSDSTKIDGTNSQIFNIGSSPEVSFSNINFVNGFAEKGGAIYNEGTLSISNCEFSNNTAKIKGGAVYNEGNLIVSNSKFNEMILLIDQ